MQQLHAPHLVLTDAAQLIKARREFHAQYMACWTYAIFLVDVVFRGLEFDQVRLFRNAN